MKLLTSKRLTSCCAKFTEIKKKKNLKCVKVEHCMGEGGGWDFKGQLGGDLTVDLCQVNLTEILSAEHS